MAEEEEMSVGRVSLGRKEWRGEMEDGFEMRGVCKMGGME